MRACWKLSPSDRISFRSIVKELIPCENEDFHLHAYYHTQLNEREQTVFMDNSNHNAKDLLLASDNNSSHD